MSSKDLLMVGDCLRNHLISIGFNPEKKERRESYKDEETHMPDGVNKPVPPNDNFSSDCQDSEPELQNLGSSGMPPNCSSAQRPALKTLVRAFYVQCLVNKNLLLKKSSYNK